MHEVNCPPPENQCLESKCIDGKCNTKRKTGAECGKQVDCGKNGACELSTCKCVDVTPRGDVVQKSFDMHGCVGADYDIHVIGTINAPELATIRYAVNAELTSGEKCGTGEAALYWLEGPGDGTHPHKGIILQHQGNFYEPTLPIKIAGLCSFSGSGVVVPIEGPDVPQEYAVTIWDTWNPGCCFEQYADLAHSKGEIAFYDFFGTGREIELPFHEVVAVSDAVDMLRPLRFKASKGMRITLTAKEIGYYELYHIKYHSNYNVSCYENIPFYVFYDVVKNESGELTAQRVNLSAQKGADENGMQWCKQTFVAPKSAWYHVGFSWPEVACLKGPKDDFPENLIEWSIEYK